MSGWQPYATVSSLPSASPSDAATNARDHRCGECGRRFSEEDMVRLDNTWICAACKPRYLQRLQEGATPALSAAWRSGRDLVVPVAASLPERCVKCNAPVQEDGRMARRFEWFHPLLYLLLIINLLVFIIVMLVVRKKALVELSVCREHRARRYRHLTVAWCLGLIGFATLIFAIFAGPGNNSLALAMIAIAFMLIGGIYGLFLGRILVARRIRDGYVWLRGADPGFLDTFPDWSSNKT
jgi:hypothetical protein